MARTNSQALNSCEQLAVWLSDQFRLLPTLQHLLTKTGQDIDRPMHWHDRLASAMTNTAATTLRNDVFQHLRNRLSHSSGDMLKLLRDEITCLEVYQHPTRAKSPSPRPSPFVRLLNNF